MDAARVASRARSPAGETWPPQRARVRERVVEVARPSPRARGAVRHARPIRLAGLDGRGRAGIVQRIGRVERFGAQPLELGQQLQLVPARGSERPREVDHRGHDALGAPARRGCAGPHEFRREQ